MTSPRLIDSHAGVRIGVVTDAIPPVFNGAGLRAYRYACRLQTQGQLAFLMAEQPAPDDDRIPDGHAYEDLPGDKIVRVPRRVRWKRRRAQDLAAHPVAFFWQSLAVLWALAVQLITRRKTYEIIYCCGAGSRLALFATLLGRLLGKKTILSSTLLGIDDPWSIQKDSHRMRRWFRTRVFTLADAYISISKPITEACLRAAVPRSKIWEIPNPVDTTLFSPADAVSRRELREAIGIEEGAFAVLFVGSIIPRKGVDLAVEAMERLCSTLRDVHLLLIGGRDVAVEGDGAFLRCLQERIRVLDLGDRVRFTGLVGDVYRYMRACDAFVFPSRAEGFPNVLVEAMASGLPVVTCPISGIAECIVTHGKDGLVVEYEAQAIAQALERLYRDRDLGDQLARNAVTTVRNRFSAEGIDEQYARVYQSLLQTDREEANRVQAWV